MLVVVVITVLIALKTVINIVLYMFNTFVIYAFIPLKTADITDLITFTTVDTANEIASQTVVNIFLTDSHNSLKNPVKDSQASNRLSFAFFQLSFKISQINNPVSFIEFHIFIKNSLIGSQ